MGKILSIVIGVIVALAGLVLLVFGTPNSIGWWYELLFILRGIIPLLLILGGVISVVAGFSEFKDTLKK